MISEVNKSIPPTGLIGGGSSISGGYANPTLVGGSEINPVNGNIPNFSMSAESGMASYPTGLPREFSSFGGYVQSSGITSVAITKSTFKSKVGSIPGAYTFTSYEDSGATRWNVNRPSSTQTSNITLSQYGITLAGTPVPGEGFIITYVQNPSTASDYSVSLSQITRTTVWRDNIAKQFLLGDFNMLAYLGTLERYRKQLGAIRTFDTSFASAIGGYPKGAQLEFLIPPNTSGLNNGDTYLLRKVVSLVDNNSVDFRTLGPDGTNWEYCDEIKYHNNENMMNTPFSGALNIFAGTIAYGGDISGSYSKTVSYTLNTDCLVCAHIRFECRRQDGSTGIVTVTKNGNTKTFYSAITDSFVHGEKYSSRIQIDNSNKIVRAGSTITLRLNLNSAIFLECNVFAIEVVSPNYQMGRI